MTLSAVSSTPADAPQKLYEDRFYAFLETAGISLTTVTHIPVFTVEEAKTVRHLCPGQGHSKNLFLRDKKKQNWLVVAQEECPIDLKGLGSLLQGARLSFGSAERLYETLAVRPGSVSPFALFGDEARTVRVVLDTGLLQHDPLYFHPLRNDKTSAISSSGLLHFLKTLGYEPLLLDLRAAC